MRFAAVLILIMCLSGAVFAQQAQNGKISLALSDTDITEAFATLSQKGNVSILGDTTVKGKVSCSLSDMTAEQALDTICKMNKLEWYKTYASTGAQEKPSASKLFKLLDALKELGGAAVICSDPVAKTQTVYIPGAEAGAVDASTLATSMKLKEIYLVRAIPVPVDKTKAPATLGTAPQGDVTAAANQVWEYFQQMPVDQRAETIHQLFTKMRENTTPEQRDAMRQQFGGRGGSGGDRGDGNRGDGNRGGQGGNNNNQGGTGHNHGTGAGTGG